MTVGVLELVGHALCAWHCVHDQSTISSSVGAESRYQEVFARQIQTWSYIYPELVLYTLYPLFVYKNGAVGTRQIDVHPSPREYIPLYCPVRKDHRYINGPAPKRNYTTW